MKRFVAIALLLFGSFSLFAQQWEAIINTLGETVYATGGAVNKFNQVVFSIYNDETAEILSVDNNGEYIKRSFDIAGEKTGFLDIAYIENIIYALGYSIDTMTETHYVRIVTTNDQLEVLSDYRYPVDEECYIHEPHGRLLVDNDGTVIATVPVVWDESVYSHPTIASFWRFNRNGELLNSHYTKSISDAFFRLIVYDMRKLDDDSSFVAIGDGWISNPSIMFFDYDFNMTDYSRIMFEDNEFLFQCDSYYSGYQFDNQHLFVVGSQSVHDITKPHLLMTKVDLEGNIEQRLVIDEPDILYRGLNSPMASAANDSTIYITSSCYERYWSNPVFGQLYLINRDMELLGSITLSDLMGANPCMVISTHDDCCIVVGRKYKDYMYVRKYSREDFNLIPCSVKDVPKEQIKATAFPNPASDEIHFDISGLPTGKENRISISDAMGRTVMSRIIRGEGNVLTVGIADFKPGIYTYQIYNAEKEIVGGKFVKE